MHRKKQGFSMVELLVAMVAAAILAITVTAVFVMPIRTIATNREYAKLRRDLAYVVRIMAMDIRKSSVMYDDAPAIDTGENELVLHPNDLRLEKISYDRNTANGVLSRSVDDGAESPIILDGLTAFATEMETNSSGVVSGVLLHLEMENSDGYIAVTNETFIHVRN